MLRTTATKQVREGRKLLFKVPPKEVAIFAKPTHKVRISIRETKLVLYYAACLVYIGAGSNTVNEADLWPPWICFIKRFDASTFARPQMKLL